MSDDIHQKTAAAAGAVADQSGIALLCNGAGMALALVMTFVHARFFGAEVYGRCRLAFTVLAVFFLFASWGLPRGLMKFVPMFASRNDKKDLASVLAFSGVLTLVLSAVATIACWASRHIVAVRVFSDPPLAAVLAIGCFAIPAITLSGLLGGVYMGARRIQYSIPYQHLLLPVMVTLLAIVAWACGWRDARALTSMLVVAEWVVLCLLVRHLPRVGISMGTLRSARRDTRLLRGFFEYSSTMLFSGFLMVILHKIDILMIGMYKTATVVGLYAVAARLSAVAVVFLTSVNMVYPSTVADLHAQEQPEALRRLCASVTKWLSAIVAPLLICCAFYSGALLRVFGPMYVEATQALQLLLVGELARIVLTGAVLPLLEMTGHHRLTLANNVVMVVLNVALNVLLIPRYSIVGAALATCVSRIAISITIAVEAKVIVGISPFTRFHWSLALVPLVSIGVCMVGSMLSRGLAGAAGVLLVSLAASALICRRSMSETDAIILRQVTRHFARLRLPRKRA